LKTFFGDGSAADISKNHNIKRKTKQPRVKNVPMHREGGASSGKEKGTTKIRGIA